MEVAIDRAACWAGPSQAILFLSVFGFLIYRRLGATPAVLWMGMAATLPPLVWAFYPQRPDHHGLQIAFQFGGFMALALGGLGRVGPDDPTARTPAMVRSGWSPSLREARRWFAAAGVLSGLAVWIGATVQIIGIGLVAALAVALALAGRWTDGREPAAGSVWRPGLWRVWGGAGALVCLLMYAIEYAPQWPGMRLEVNNPLYALAFWCAGCLAADVLAWRAGRAPRRLALRLALALAGALLPVALTLWGPEAWHVYRDPMLWRLRRFTAELFPLAARTRFGLLPELAIQFGLLWLMLPYGVVLAVRGRGPGGEALRWAAGYATAFFALALAQSRWLPFGAAALAWMGTVLYARLSPPRARVLAFALVLQIVAQGTTQAIDIRS